MMRDEAAESRVAVLAQEKVIEYLLSHQHPSGRSKARFFEGFGFERTNWTQLVEALKSHARSNEIARTETSLFGTRYVIEDSITTPDGRSPGFALCGLFPVARQYPISSPLIHFSRSGCHDQRTG